MGFSKNFIPVSPLAETMPFVIASRIFERIGSGYLFKPLRTGSDTVCPDGAVKRKPIFGPFDPHLKKS